MKVKLLKKLRKEAEKKIKLYQVGRITYKITSPYSYMSDSYYICNRERAIDYATRDRIDYILVKVDRMRKKKEQKYPILINI